LFLFHNKTENINVEERLHCREVSVESKEHALD